MAALLLSPCAVALPLYLGELIVTESFERGFVDVRKPDHFGELASGMRPIPERHGCVFRR